MTNVIEPDHPTCNFVFLFVGNLTDEIAKAFEEMLVSAGSGHEWVIGAPQLIDYMDEFQDRPDAERFQHTYGGVLQLYSAFPPWGDKLPKEIDRLHYEETKWLIEALGRFSTAFACEFKLHMDETVMGFVRDEKPDRNVQQGLLDEWKRVLGI